MVRIMGKDLKGKELGKGFSQRKNGLYMARFKLDKQTYTLYSKDLKKLKKDFVKYKQDVEENSISNMYNFTVNQLFDFWFENYSINLKNTSIRNLSDDYKRVKDSIGHLKVRDVRQSHIQKIVQELIDKGYAYRTIESSKNFLCNLFNKAIENRIIIYNPCSGVVMPFKSTREKVPLDKEMEKKFFQAIYGQRYEELFHILLYTGMRLGEAVALEWKDIDFENRRISISKTMLRLKQYNRKNQKIRDERVYITSPKTYTSIRIIPMSNYVASQFLKWKAKQEMDKQKLSNWGEKNYLLKEYPELIFTTSKGMWLPPSDAWRYCAQGVSRVNEIEIHIAELEHREPNLLVLYPHLLRHTYATRCVEQGMNPKAIQKLLGHASEDMLNVYTHPSLEFLDDECRKHPISPETTDVIDERNKELSYN